MGTSGQRKGQGLSAHNGGGSSAAKARGGKNPTTRELNLKVRGLPTPPPSTDPMELGNRFLCDTLDIPDITLDKA